MPDQEPPQRTHEEVKLLSQPTLTYPTVQVPPAIPDMIEATTHAQGALAHSGVFKPSTKLSAVEAAHASRVAFWAEPRGLARVCWRLSRPHTPRMERSQAGSAAYYQACGEDPCKFLLLGS